MCHAHVHPKFMLRDTENRFRAAQAASQTQGEAGSVDDTVPPHLIPGWRGVWARICAVVPRRRVRPVAAE